jgi:phosphohistidine phosphatase
MKRILLLRHGKSDWNAEYATDHDRPLKARGVHGARTMGLFLTATDQQPEIIVSSSAVRALTTAQLAAEAGEWDCEIRVEPGLYGTGPRGVLEHIQAVDDRYSSVLLTGHEPTFSQVTGDLVGRGRVRFPTAALACIDVPVTRWGDVEFHGGVLIFFVTPKLLAKAGLDAEA